MSSQWSRARESTRDWFGVGTPTSHGSLPTQSAETRSVAGGLAVVSVRSVAAVTELTALLEGLSAELVDTGAMYSPDGNQVGPRDAVYELQDDTELVCRIYHNPRKVEIEYNYDRPIPPDIADAIRQWELA